MDKLQGDLMAMGFTEYEARVYLALLRESPATGYQIGKLAGVPRSMVYEALGRLHVRGAIFKTEEPKATLYRPVPPDALIDRYEQEHTRLLHSLREGLRGLYTPADEDRFWSISGREAVLAYAAQMLERAAEEAMVVVADAELADLRPAIRAACARGVAVSTLLTGEDSLDCGRVAYHPREESELQQLTGTLTVVRDFGEVLIASTSPEMTATVTGNRNLVFIARQFVWMEMFAQRVYARFGSDLLEQLDPEDRPIFEGIVRQQSHGGRA